MKYFISLFFIISHAHAIQELRTRTTEGDVLGRKFKDYTYYQSIPYAMPPVGELRWRAPKAPLKRSTLLNGFSKRIQCAQMENFFSGTSVKEFGKVVGSEDCLYLNIWKPNTSGKKPVFFWIHGGSNAKGLALDEMYDGSVLAQKLDAVVVTVNYRLGLLGAFKNSKLKFDDPLDQSGNYTTLDLLRALDWTRENIKNFGGDPELITIAGESAGCMNVWGLIQTPLAKDKFQRAYCASGMPNNYPVIVAHQVSELMLRNSLKDKGVADPEQALSDMTDAEVKKHLYSLTTEEVILAYQFPVPVQHISDGHVFSKLGLGVLATGQFNRVPVMLGHNQNELTLFVAPLASGASPNDFWEMLNLRASNQPLFDLINNRAKYEAFRTADEGVNKSFQLIMDTVMSISGVYMPKAYRYEMGFKSNFEPWKSMFLASHGIDIPILFHLKDIKGSHFLKFLEKDLNLPESRKVMDGYTSYMKNFVYTGDPNSGQLTPWKSWSALNLRAPYIEVTNKGFEAKSRLTRVLTMPELIYEIHKLNQRLK